MLIAHSHIRYQVFLELGVHRYYRLVAFLVLVPSNPGLELHGALVHVHSLVEHITHSIVGGICLKAVYTIEAVLSHVQLL